MVFLLKGKYLAEINFIKVNAPKVSPILENWVNCKDLLVIYYIIVISWRQFAANLITKDNHSI